MSTKSIFLQGYSRKPVQVQRYNHPEYKHALDDAIEKLLTHDHKYKQIHTLPDTKMLLGYIAVAFAAYGTYLSYGLALEMPQIKYTLLVCVIGFFTFQSLMMGYSRWIEGDIVFQGRKVDLVGRNDEHVSVSSKCAHLDDKYALEIVWTRGGKKSKYSTVQSVGRWFRKDGTLVAEDFKRDFESLFEKAKSSKKE